jgi:hypothetical protein
VLRSPQRSLYDKTGVSLFQSRISDRLNEPLAKQPNQRSLSPKSGDRWFKVKISDRLNEPLAKQLNQRSLFPKSGDHSHQNLAIALQQN